MLRINFEEPWARLAQLAGHYARTKAARTEPLAVRPIRVTIPRKISGHPSPVAVDPASDSG